MALACAWGSEDAGKEGGDLPVARLGILCLTTKGMGEGLQSYVQLLEQIGAEHVVLPVVAGWTVPAEEKGLIKVGLTLMAAMT